MKKVLSFILALCMICTLLPATVLAADTTVVFTMGADGSASHADGSSKTSYTETVDGYTLSLTGGTSMYTGARDAKGNGCIKLGTSSKTGGFTISSIPADVTSVIIAIAGYKNKSVTVKIDNVSYTVSELSNNGAYKNIEIDTTTNKTITLITSTNYRAMVNSITYVIADSGSSCAHENVTTTVTKAPSCTATGEEEWECEACGETGTNTLEKIDHSLVDVEGYAATCTEDGLEDGKACENCDYTEQEVIPAGHNYVNGICSACGAEEPNEVTGTISFASTAQRDSQTTTKQVWSNEDVVFTNNKASSSTNVGDYSNPVRLYANSELVFEAPGNITKIEVVANSSSYATVLKNSVGDEATVSGSTVTIVPAASATTYTVAKLTAQTRFNSLTITYVKAGSSSCLHTNKDTLPAEAPSCTEDGKLEGWVCTDCGYEEQEVDPATGHNKVDGEEKAATCTEPGLTAGQYCTKCDYTEQEVIPAGHKYENGVCSGCGQELPNEATITFDDTSKRTEFTTSQQVWEENGITATNEKGSGTTNMGDYSGPVRFYKNSNLTIAYPAAMCQIVFDCNSGSYANAMADAITDGTVTVNSDKVIFVPTTPAESFTFTLSSDQVRMDSITIICNVAEVDGTKYASLEAALENTTGTLKLLVDQTVETIDSTLVIDLNGKTLTADSIVATVKDSADGTGLVKVAQGSAVLSSVDGQMILWDNATAAPGYRAFSYTMDDMTSGGTATEAEQEKGFTNIKTFWNVLRFTNTYAYTLVASEYSGLNTVTFTLEWGGVEKTFAFAAGDIVAWAKQEVENTDDDFGFYIRVTGFENVESGTLTVTAAVKSDYGTNEKTMVTTYEYEKV